MDFVSKVFSDFLILAARNMSTFDVFEAEDEAQIQNLEPMIYLEPVTQTEGEHTWNIADATLMNEIINAKNGVEFQSKDFEMANLDWRMQINPN